MIGCLLTQALFVYATHATQAIAFEWKPGFSLYSVTVAFIAWQEASLYESVM